MKKIGLVILLLGISLVFLSGSSFAAQKKSAPVENGRYQIYFHPTDKNIVYLIDTQDGRLWQSAFDNKIKLRYWRPMPVEGLDYPISSYKKPAVKFFFKKKRGLLN